MNGTGDVVLVTGGSGNLGGAIVRRLRADGRAVRVAARGPAPDGTAAGEWARVDYASGAGLDAAMAGVGTVVHAATVIPVPGKRQPYSEAELAGTVAAAAKRAGVGHLVYVSIVGVDAIPYPYFAAKHAAELAVEASGVSWTVQRATQFHDLVLTVLDAFSRSPVMPVLGGVSDQPVAVADAADRFAELVAAGPSGRAPDLGGPEVLTFRELTRAYLAARGLRRALLPLRLPGRTYAAYAAGKHLCPAHADGRITFADALAGRYGRAAA